MEEDKISFQAKLITQNQEDKQRVFLITYFVENKEMSIQEGRSPVCSSPKSYFSRGKITSKATGLPYETHDFFIGSTIIALGRRFYLTDASKATLDFMEIHCDNFPMSDLNAAVDALKPAKKQVISQFNRIDTRGRGFINSEAAQQILDSVRIAPQYVVTIMRRFDEKGNFDYGTLSQYL